MKPSPDGEIGRAVSSALDESTGSYELVFAAMAAGGLGFLIDRALGTTPATTIIFLLAGFVGAAYSLWLRYTAKMQIATQQRSSRVAGSSDQPIPDGANAEATGPFAVETAANREVIR